MATTACARAWSIAEIRDQILLELPLHEILRNLCVCRDWANSSKILEVVFLRPTNTRIHEQYTWPNGLPVLPIEPYKNDTFYRGWDSNQRGYLERGLIDGQQSALGIEWTLCRGPEVFHREISSWRRMQVMQPAATILKFQCFGMEVAENGNDLAVRPPDEIDENGTGDRPIKVPTFGTVYEVSNPGGVTLGDLIDAFRRHWKVCPDCGHFPDVYDAAGNVLKVWWFDGMRHMRVVGRESTGIEIAEAITVEERVLRLDWKGWFKWKEDGFP
ncbi:hypothetical protein M409DRAFT_53676 [Zasmidium cellare ATCC 36951]|uniref:F-box domain-containing protein n=1 Tax=Zasmidium cellare ATCC 36951 TaxID=1080233 RepID=A0A6A6CM59_ZASCE|nr:uncharacterized protein M409DRAFT_53676 [Zasmidium cellare ATCC 36951]KAF2167693.1 hypothetical protein M409DRAFT_53676 [Zasmidium cellare ATCC 36951]